MKLSLPFGKKTAKADSIRLSAPERHFIEEVNNLEPAFEKLSDADLKAKTAEFRQRIATAVREAGDELPADRRQKIEQSVIDKLLPEAFAAVREAAKRTIDHRHFDVQLIGGLSLYKGKIAEMRTGEGKTLVATLPLYAQALAGHGAHLITVNDYLSRRDAGWMGPIYHALGLTVATIGHETSLLFDPAGSDTNHADERLNHFVAITRQEAYAADITYGTNNEYGFDYLRDNMAVSLDSVVQRELAYAIVDEVDSILIDEARTPLIISRPAEESGSLYAQFAAHVRRLKEEEDYTVDEKERRVSLTDVGIKRMERAAGVENLFDAESVLLAHHLEEALKAKALFKRDKDYIIKDGEIVIVDEFTGRLMPGRRYSEGLHQALEAKEGVLVNRESDTLATISFQNFFRLYWRLAGMTGTAKTEEEEFWKIYGLAVDVIPTNRPMIRLDHPDRIYKTEEAKWQAIVAEVKERHDKGQPILIGTASIEKNEYLAELLTRAGVEHSLLNAKNHEKEALVITDAGKPGAVTVATNMAGRGTDIKVDKELSQFGGLHVLGTERHESRRIDNQLRGRTGRQGDPGSSQFYVSLEDDLMRIFGGDRLKNLMTALKVPDDMPIESPMVSRAIQSAQRRVEGHNFDIRKHLVEYDDVMNKHRTRIYRDRRRILEHSDLKTEMAKTLEAEVRLLWQSKAEFDEDLPDLQKALSGLLHANTESVHDVEQAVELANSIYAKRETHFSSDVMREIERAVALRSIDMLWVDHLNAMEQLRHSIGMVGYSQREPLVEYKARAYELFQVLLRTIQRQTIELLFRAEIVQQPAPLLTNQAIEQAPSETLTSGGVHPDSQPLPVIDEAVDAPSLAIEQHQPTVEPSTPGDKPERIIAASAHVGRNDPCPCGAKKPDGTPVKFKKCHGEKSE